MAKKKGKGGVLSSDPYNEMGPGISDDPQTPMDEYYYTYGQAAKFQSSQKGGDMADTPNSRSGQGIIGGPAPGEPNPADVSTENESH